MSSLSISGSGSRSSDSNDVDDIDGGGVGDVDDSDRGDDEKEMEEYIQHHVDARAAMKKEGKFDSADKIRLDLAQR